MPYFLVWSLSSSAWCIGLYHGSEMPHFLVWSLSSSAWCIMQYTVYPCLVSCPLYVIPIYPFQFMKFFIYMSPFIFFFAFSKLITISNTRSKCHCVNKNITRQCTRQVKNIYRCKFSCLLVFRLLRYCSSTRRTKKMKNVANL